LRHTQYNLQGRLNVETGQADWVLTLETQVSGATLSAPNRL
jgi:hypothetical protein